jgi:hypothetical protein
MAAAAQPCRGATDNEWAMEVTPHPEDGPSVPSEDARVSTRSRGVGTRLLATLVVVVEALWVAALVVVLIWLVLR